MSIFRVFYFAITAGISGCLCKSVDKKKLNFFKVNAQPKTRGAEGGYGDHDWASDYSLDNICSKSGCIVESKDAPPRAEVGLLLTPKKEEFAREQFWLEHYKPLYPHPDYPDNWYIELGDFVIHYDSITYEPQYSMELVTKEKVTEINRRRCQTFRAGYDPEEYVSHKEIYEEDPKYLKAIQVAEKSSLGRKVEKELCGLSDSTPMVDLTSFGQKIVAYIEEQSGFTPWSCLWDDFYHYVRYLTKQHDIVYVCSGPLYLPEQVQGGIKYVDSDLIKRKKIPLPTHFYKVIMGSNKDGTYRYECYKFKNEVITDKHRLMENYRVDRKILQNEAGMIIFQMATPNLIKQNKTDKRYYKHSQCPLCFDFETAV